MNKRIWSGIMLTGVLIAGAPLEAQVLGGGGAVRGALGAHTVTAVIVPKDVQELKAFPYPPHKMNYTASIVPITSHQDVEIPRTHGNDLPCRIFRVPDLHSEGIKLSQTLSDHRSARHFYLSLHCVVTNLLYNIIII